MMSYKNKYNCYKIELVLFPEVGSTSDGWMDNQLEQHSFVLNTKKLAL